MFLVLIEHVVDDLFATPAHEVVVAASFAKEDFGAAEGALIALGRRLRTFVVTTVSATASSRLTTRAASEAFSNSVEMSSSAGTIVRSNHFLTSRSVG